MTMGRCRSFAYRSVRLNWVGAVLAALLVAGCAAQPGTTTPASPLAPGMARVWFLRQADPPGGNAFAAVPTVFVDRAPLAQIAQGAVFYHDFAPGRYRLSAQAFGTPAGQHDILHLDPGTETYVQIIGVANWELGATVGGWSFAVLPMSPEVATQYLPTLTALGQR
jgi:hypothetical protein